MTDSILIIGGGIAGLTAALECAAAGARAIVVEQDAIAGGRLAGAMTRKSSAGDMIDGAAIPKLETLANAANVEFFTMADVEEVQGRPGNFDIVIRERARFVTEDCTRCNRCPGVCPVVRANEHESGLSYRKAIYTPFPETLPQEFVIDIDACLNTPPNYLPCNRCTEVCDDDAIVFDMPHDRVHRRQVGAIVLATGNDVVNDANATERGYGMHPDIVTAAEMETLLTAPGPTGGFAARPSNEDYANSILLVLDELTPVTVHTLASQVARLIAQDVGRIAVLVTRQPVPEEEDILRATLPEGLTVKFGLWRKVEARADDKITVTYADFASNQVPEEQYDMIVIGSSIKPPAGLDQLAGVIGCELTDNGFVARTEPPCTTSCEGVYVAGGAGGPTLLRDAVEESKAAASAALGHLDERLLRGEHRSTDRQSADDVAGVSEDELRSRLEHALLAMLESNN